LLTNPYTDISGIYELPIKLMAVETGIDRENLEKVILPRFEVSNKILYRNGWIAIRNFIKHQSLNPSVQKGIDIGLSKAPIELKEFILSAAACTQPVHRLSHLNSNSNLNSNLNIKKKSETSSQLPVKKEEKKKYGEFENVLLTDIEHSKLDDRFGTSLTSLIIEELSGYVESKGRRYSSHYATLLGWARRKKDSSNSRGKSVSIID
jgi:hypothetical protein